MPSKLTSSIKKALDKKHKQNNKKSVGAFEIEKEIAGLNAQKVSLRLQ